MLQYGCDTGPGACFLAARGFRVDAVDLVPRAIRLARRFAAERGLTIDFRVGDICALADVPPTKQYDLIVDSYCRQSIVTDADRSRLFAAVRARLKPGRRYLISTAMRDPDRCYDGARYDQATGVVLDRLGWRGRAPPPRRGRRPGRRPLVPAASAPPDAGIAAGRARAQRLPGALAGRPTRRRRGVRARLS